MPFLLLTYLFSFVDISSLLYEQPHNIGATISCSFCEQRDLQNVEKKNNEKVHYYIKRIFLLL